MKKLGLVLLIMGYVGIIAQVASHDPPSKVFAVRFIDAIDADQTFRGDEVRKQMGKLVMGFYDRRPWVFIPATLMLVGGILLCSSPSPARERGVPTSESTATLR